MITALVNLMDAVAAHRPTENARFIRRLRRSVLFVLNATGLVLACGAVWLLRH